MSKSTFARDLQSRIHAAEQIIADQNESLAALRHLLHKELGESAPANGSNPTAITLKTAPETRTHAAIDFAGKQSEIVLALVQQSGENGTRPRDIAAILVGHKLIKKGSNAVHSHLSELRKKGLVKQNAKGLYVASSKAIAAKATTAEPVVSASTPAKAGKKKRSMSAAGREAIRKAQKARWATVKKAKG